MGIYPWNKFRYFTSSLRFSLIKRSIKMIF